jgi:agmatine/peptidylarginine deiminase
MKPVIDASLSAEAGRLQLEYDPAHLHLVPWDTDTFWTRDFGPWWVRNNVTGTYAIAKHTYTTLGGGSVGLVEGAEHVDPHLGLGIFRPNDDYAAIAFSDFLNAPIRAWNAASWGSQNARTLTPLPVHDWYFTGLLDVGGNYMVTGQNKIASSYLVATQNELPTRNEEDNTKPSPAVLERRLEYILQQLNRFMGIASYHVLSDPTGTYIGHVDCWGKFLADDKILIAQSQDEATNAAFDRIAQSFVEDGFRVYRTMVQDMYIAGPANGATTAAYTNSLILNGCVYVPLAGPGHEQFDQQALAAYREALPGYQVIGIPGNPAFPWLGTDAMHCRTRAVPREVVDNWLKAQAPAAP